MRRSKREIERDLAALQEDTDPHGGTEIVIHETVVGSDWSGSELEPGESVETTERIEL